MQNLNRVGRRTLIMYGMDSPYALIVAGLTSNFCLLDECRVVSYVILFRPYLVGCNCIWNFYLPRGGNFKI